MEKIIESATNAWRCVRDEVKWVRAIRGDEIPEEEIYYCCKECKHFKEPNQCIELSKTTNPETTVQNCLFFDRKVNG